MQDGLVVQLGGDGDLTWQVMMAGDTEDLLTMLQVHREGVLVANSGFGGPPLYPGTLVNEWRGRTDDLPYFVMVRTAPAVLSVVAVTERGIKVAVPLSDVVAVYGLRFGAAALPPGEVPAWLRATTADGDLPELGTAPGVPPWSR